MTKRVSTTETTTTKNYTSIDDIKKSYQTNINVLIEKDNINNESYKRKYNELKEKVNTIKKLRITDTEQLFEEFKIKAEQRDSDAKKLINKIKRELDNYKQSNKVLKETLNSNHGFDCETIRKDIMKSIEDDHKFSITQLKLQYDEKIQQLELQNQQLLIEKESNQLKVNTLEHDLDKMKQDQTEQQEKQHQDKEQLIKEFQDKFGKELQQYKEQQEKEQKEQIEKVVKRLSILPSGSTNNILSSTPSTTTNNNTTTIPTVDTAKIEKYYKEIIYDLKLKFEEESKNTIEKYENALKKINKKLQEKQLELQQLKDSNEQSKLELQREFQEIQSGFDEKIQKKDQELQEQLKKHNEEIEEFEEKLSKLTNSNDDSLPTIESLLKQLKDQNIDLNNLVLKNTINLKYIELFEILTSTKITQITDTTYEMICFNESNGAKIHLKFSIEDDAFSCSTISLDNCKDINNMFSEDIVFNKENASAFLANMLSTLLSE